MLKPQNRDISESLIMGSLFETSHCTGATAYNQDGADIGTEVMLTTPLFSKYVKIL